MAFLGGPAPWTTTDEKLPTLVQKSILILGSILVGPRGPECEQGAYRLAVQSAGEGEGGKLKFRLLSCFQFLSFFLC